MPTSALRSSKRLPALSALLGLLVLFTLTLVLVGLRELLPAERPPAQSRLLAVLDGSMAVNTTPAERQRIRAWLEAGSPREGLPAMEAVAANNCASCHASGGEYPRLTGAEHLQHLGCLREPSPATALLPTRVLHLLVFPLLFLWAGGLLARSPWPHRRALTAACALAVILDASQWWLGAGRPEFLWVARAAALLLTVAMAVLAAVVIREPGRSPSRP
jgi:hypothetical protein